MSLANRLAEERRARLAAERLLELKQAELFAANRKLGQHARALSHRIEETQAEVETVRNENQRVKSDLTAAHQKVEIAERRLWLSLQTVQDGFAFYDEDGNLIMANPAYLSIFDGLEEVAPGINYSRILQVLTDEGIVDTQGVPPAEWRANMTRRWQSRQPDPEILRLWNNQYIRMIDRRNPAGDVVSLSLNITASVQYEKRLRDAQRRAESANRAKSAFLANMSHEIRTPMNGVVGMADLLADTDLSEEQQLYVRTIRNSGEALLVIINDVLDYSKIEADRLVLQLEAFDLERAIHEVVLLLQPAARDKGIDLLVDYDIFMPSMFVGDVGRMRQALTNLIGNAVKFTQSGHVLVRAVGLPADDDATAVHLTVEDTGIGISKDRLNDIFGEFNQVDDDRNRQFEGTGLGLTITKRLIELMNGEVWVDSEEGVGSSFGLRVTLPNAESEADLVLKPDQLQRAIVADPQHTGRQILCNQMQSLGLETQVCDTGAEVMAQLSCETDVVLTDGILPDMDALDLAHTLRNQGASVPIVVFSDNPSKLRADPEAARVQSILPKPAPRRMLLEELCNLYTAKTTSRPTRVTPRAPSADMAWDDAPPLRVLLAEDNRTNQLVFRKMVEPLNLELLYANNGAEAVAQVEEHRPDLVFMDISMPMMDGKEATRRIRSFPDAANLPIIAVTAHAMAGDKEEFLAVGLTDYLTKPLRKDALLAMIDRYRTNASRKTGAA